MPNLKLYTFSEDVFLQLLRTRYSDVRDAYIHRCTYPDRIHKSNDSKAIIEMTAEKLAVNDGRQCFDYSEYIRSEKDALDDLRRSKIKQHQFNPEEERKRAIAEKEAKMASMTKKTAKAKRNKRLMPIAFIAGCIGVAVDLAVTIKKDGFSPFLILMPICVAGAIGFFLFMMKMTDKYTTHGDAEIKKLQEEIQELKNYKCE